MKLQTLKSSVPMLDTRRVQTIQAGSWRTSDQTAAQRGYGYKWQQARAQYLREHPLCVMCRADDRVTAATVVDHIVPHRGDQSLFWRRSNWQSLCPIFTPRALASSEREMAQPSLLLRTTTGMPWSAGRKARSQLT